ncbi:unnamed protein product [Parnassius apollo]|nr:unnamed protein product [Parnassius apollo]
MSLNEGQIADLLQNENSDSEIEDNLEVDPYDSDDSAADPSFVPFRLEEDLQNILVDDSEPPNILIPYQATSNASDSLVPASQEEQTAENLIILPSASTVREMMDEILLRTNEDILVKASKYKQQSSTISMLRIEELL